MWQNNFAMKDKDKNQKMPERIAWEMFEKSGNPAYYMLYKKLKGID